MKKKKSIEVFIFLLVVLISCKEKQTIKKFNVQYAGALHNIMSGNIASVISLDSLSSKNNLFALGAMENLKGEIQIFNGDVYNSIVEDNNLKISKSLNVNAALLVYADVEQWESFELESVQTKLELETKIFEVAKSQQIDIENPFPFLIEGRVASLDWHVINWKENDSIHTHEKHKNSGLSGSLKNEKVSIIGFYSAKHKAVFTHHTTNMHLHFKTENNSVAGHVDDLKINEEITLKLPNQ